MMCLRRIDRVKNKEVKKALEEEAVISMVKEMQRKWKVKWPRETSKALAANVNFKGKVVQMDILAVLEHCWSFTVQGQTIRQLGDHATDLWFQLNSVALPDHVMRFALNSVSDTLPHNANVHLRGKTTSAKCQLNVSLNHVFMHPMQYFDGKERIQWEAWQHILSSI